jgi:hypothetical protein
MTTKELDALQALCDEATAGPWNAIDKGNTVPSYAIRHFAVGEKCVNVASGISPKTGDADFIAVARTAMPALIGEVRRLQERCEAAERDLELHGGCPSCAAQTGGGGVPCGFFALDTSVPRARCRNYSWRGPHPTKEANQ